MRWCRGEANFMLTEESRLQDATIQFVFFNTIIFCKTFPTTFSAGADDCSYPGGDSYPDDGDLAYPGGDDYPDDGDLAYPGGDDNYGGEYTDAAAVAEQPPPVKKEEPKKKKFSGNKAVTSLKPIRRKVVDVNTVRRTTIKKDDDGKLDDFMAGV